MHESGGSWFYHHAECCELRCRCILHSRRRSYPRSCLPPLVVPVHSRSNRLVALSRSGCPTHAMTAPFPIEQPHSPLFDPRGLPHAEAARASNPENERMDQHHHVCENATDMYSESCVAITAAQHGDDPHRPCVYTLDERARERTSFSACRSRVFEKRAPSGASANPQAAQVDQRRSSKRTEHTDRQRRYHIMWCGPPHCFLLAGIECRCHR